MSLPASRDEVYSGVSCEMSRGVTVSGEISLGDEISRITVSGEISGRVISGRISRTVGGEISDSTTSTPSFNVL